MKALLTLTAIGLMIIAPLSLADRVYQSGENKTSVVELYTSEGCSSCPPADEFLSLLGQTDEADQIVPLAFHVDYWDYIGWSDPYAKAKYTARQREVGKMNKQSTIYTPEFVVDGKEARGSRKITKRLKVARKMPAEADIELSLSDASNQIHATVSVSNLVYDGDEIPEVYIAVYENDLTSSIDAGENRGRTLKHDYVVRHISETQLTQNGGAHQFDLMIDPKWNRDALGITAIVRLRESGRTLQALKGAL